MRAQTFSDWECICVDDGSTDESGGILDEYAVKDARFRVFHKPNGGVSSARNLALKEVKGEWVLFLDGDDVWSPKVLEIISNGVVDHPKCELFRFKRVEFSEVEMLHFSQGKDAYFSSLDISREIATQDFVDYLFCCYAFKAALISDLRFPPYARGEDRIFIGDVLLSRVGWLYVADTVLYGYRQRQGSAVHSRPTVQVLKDELSHRADVIGMIDASGKQMPYKGTRWLEGYCLKEYLQLAEGRGNTYSKSERRELVKWFYHERKRFAKAKDYSFPGKVLAHLYGVPLGYFWRKSLMCMIELYAFVSRMRKRG